MSAHVRVVERHGTVAELHAADLFADLHPSGDVTDVVICQPTGAAIALGSRQRTDIVDLAACERLGLAVAGRRSGGGAVVIEPEAVVWVDIVVPAADMSFDVRTSMVQIGEHWAAALDRAASGDHLVVHRGGMVSTAWSDLICFAGVGPGEVLMGDHKLVGLSQRRTRFGSRYQGMIHVEPIQTDARSLFGVKVPPVPIPPVALIGGVTAASVAAELAAVLEGA